MTNLQKLHRETIAQIKKVKKHMAKVEPDATYRLLYASRELGSVNAMIAELITHSGYGTCEVDTALLDGLSIMADNLWSDIIKAYKAHNDNK